MEAVVRSSNTRSTGRNGPGGLEEKEVEDGREGLRDGEYGIPKEEDVRGFGGRGNGNQMRRKEKGTQGRRARKRER